MAATSAPFRSATTENMLHLFVMMGTFQIASRLLCVMMGTFQIPSRLLCIFQSISECVNDSCHAESSKPIKFLVALMVIFYAYVNQKLKHLLIESCRFASYEKQF